MSGDRAVTPWAAGTQGRPVVLGVAADLVEWVGLWPGVYWPGYDEDRGYRAGDPVCLFGAVVVAADPTGEPRCGDAYWFGTSPWWAWSPPVVAAVAAVARYLGVTTTDPAGGVWAWSAAAGRTAGEVVAVLRGGRDAAVLERRGRL